MEYYPQYRPVPSRDAARRQGHNIWLWAIIAIVLLIILVLLVIIFSGNSNTSTINTLPNVEPTNNIPIEIPIEVNTSNELNTPETTENIQITTNNEIPESNELTLSEPTIEKPVIVNNFEPIYPEETVNFEKTQVQSTIATDDYSNQLKQAALYGSYISFLKLVENLQSVGTEYNYNLKIGKQYSLSEPVEIYLENILYSNTLTNTNEYLFAYRLDILVYNNNKLVDSMSAYPGNGVLGDVILTNTNNYLIIDEGYQLSPEKTGDYKIIVKLNDLGTNNVVEMEDNFVVI